MPGESLEREVPRMSVVLVSGSLQRSSEKGPECQYRSPRLLSCITVIRGRREEDKDDMTSRAPSSSTDKRALVGAPRLAC